jgi:hypothetical protein
MKSEDVRRVPTAVPPTAGDHPDPDAIIDWVLREYSPPADRP